MCMEGELDKAIVAGPLAEWAACPDSETSSAPGLPISAAKVS